MLQLAPNIGLATTQPAQAGSRRKSTRTMFDNWIDWAIYKAVNFYECLERNLLGRGNILDVFGARWAGN